VNLGISFAFHAELLGVMNAIEIAHEKGWWNLWLETDSLMVTLAYKSSFMVPWMLRNRWNNCMVMLKDMNFILSHIYREGNALADKLASLGFSYDGFNWFNVISKEILQA
jgi:ribonuclease HI